MCPLKVAFWVEETADAKWRGRVERTSTFSSSEGTRRKPVLPEWNEQRGSSKRQGWEMGEGLEGSVKKGKESKKYKLPVIKAIMGCKVNNIVVTEYGIRWVLGLPR